MCLTTIVQASLLFRVHIVHSIVSQPSPLFHVIIGVDMILIYSALLQGICGSEKSFGDANYVRELKKGLMMWDT